MSPTVVFAGGGHSHLYSPKRAGDLIQAGAHVLLIAPENYQYYSGMGPGMLSRLYEPFQARFDIKGMVESKGGRFIKAAVVSIDPEGKTILLDSGTRIGYHLVSFNIGSHIPADAVPGAEDIAYPVKPIENLERLQSEILRQIGKRMPQILIIGAGPAGVELAGNIWRLAEISGGKAWITLVSSREKILPMFPSKAGELAELSLTKRGICIMRDFRARSLSEKKVFDASGRTLTFDIAILATGIIPKGIFRGSGLAAADDGSLLVDNHLQSLTHPDVYGAGDCVTLEGGKLDRVGVHAVRQAPILFHNLLARLRNEPPASFKPQRKYLLILNLGDGTGLFLRPPFVFRGRWAFGLKDYLDRKFMQQF